MVITPDNIDWLYFQSVRVHVHSSLSFHMLVLRACTVVRVRARSVFDESIGNGKS